MHNGRFDAVIFDFGGVFTTSPVENFAVFEKRRGLPDRFIGGVIKSRSHDGAFARFERGEIGVGDFSALFAEETRAAGHEIDGDEFLGLLAVTPKPEMVAALKRVKAAGLKTGCITNNFPKAETSATDFASSPDPLFAEAFINFDRILESSRVGVRKPEPEIYEMMCEALGVAASRCVFLDDLGVNLKPARAMGMRTIKVPFGDVRPAIAELSILLGLSLS